jgi:SAM-dependent methyltransferase
MVCDQIEGLKSEVRRREGWSVAVDTARRLAETVRSRWPHDAPKFLNLEHWLDINVRRAAKLGLDRATGLNVLDLGSGTGLFLFVCEALGHTATGVDLPEESLDSPEREIYGAMPAAFGVQVIPRYVHAFEHLDVTGKFDLITSFMVCFNNHKQPDEWNRPEWEYFVADVTTLLKPGGRLALRLNHNEEKFGQRGYLDRAAQDFFASIGSLDDGKILIAPDQPRPSSASTDCMVRPNHRDCP